MKELQVLRKFHILGYHEQGLASDMRLNAIFGWYEAQYLVSATWYIYLVE